jgi:hypothetical protein
LALSLLASAIRAGVSGSFRLSSRVSRLRHRGSSWSKARRFGLPGSSPTLMSSLLLLSLSVPQTLPASPTGPMSASGLPAPSPRVAHGLAGSISRLDQRLPSRGPMGLSRVMPGQPPGLDQPAAPMARWRPIAAPPPELGQPAEQTEPRHQTPELVGWRSARARLMGRWPVTQEPHLGRGLLRERMEPRHLIVGRWPRPGIQPGQTEPRRVTQEPLPAPEHLRGRMVPRHRILELQSGLARRLRQTARLPRTARLRFGPDQPAQPMGRRLLIVRPSHHPAGAAGQLPASDSRSPAAQPQGAGSPATDASGAEPRHAAETVGS